MTTPRLAIIGGSGIYDLAGLVDTRWVAVDTPWGAPSDDQSSFGGFGKPDPEPDF